MIEEKSYQTKFQLLEPWSNQIFQAIKKELKGEHLRKEGWLVLKYFKKKGIEKLTTEELAEAYMAEISSGNEEVGEWVASRWVLKHTDLYQLFASELTKVNPKFDEIVEIPSAISQGLMASAIDQGGAIATYVFSILNSVSFSNEEFDMLRRAAEGEKEEAILPEGPVMSVSELKVHHEKEMQKLVDKYEKKLLGLERKYMQDVEGLRKQIGQLHKRASSGVSR